MRVILLALLLCNDSVLSGVAKQLADRKARGETTDEAQLAYFIHSAGDAHPWPRAWLGSDPSRGEAWNASWKRSGDGRCGATPGAVVGIDALADLETAIPLRARTGQWISVEARMLVPASAARVVVSTNDADPRPILSSFDAQAQRIRARVSADRPGAMTIQVIADVATGPRPVIETTVFVDVEPQAQPQIAPGEHAGSSGDLGKMLDAMRAELGLPALARDPKLDALAIDHARRMMRQQSTTHDAGDGTPIDRLRDAGITASEAGENVAHAASIVRAHRALWNSPSHRKNLVRSDFVRVGLAAVADADGTVWVTEIFVR